MPSGCCDAAADAFADKGFHATTTRDIASRAGLSPAGVYVHFATKEDLLFHLSARGHLAALDSSWRRPSGRDPRRTQLARSCAAFAEWHAEHFQMARIVQYEFPHLTPEHRDGVLGLRKDIDARGPRRPRRGVASGDFDVDDLPTPRWRCCRWPSTWPAGTTRHPAHAGGDRPDLCLPRPAPRGAGASPARGMVPVVTLLTYALRHG